MGPNSLMVVYVDPLGWVAIHIPALLHDYRNSRGSCICLQRLKFWKRPVNQKPHRVWGLEGLGFRDFTPTMESHGKAAPRKLQFAETLANPKLTLNPKP